MQSATTKTWALAFGGMEKQGAAVAPCLLFYFT